MAAGRGGSRLPARNPRSRLHLGGDRRNVATGFPGRFGQLGQQQDVGPVHLAPGGIWMREQVPSERTGGSGIRHSFPVIASGHVSTYVWDRAALTAEVLLRRTCALLSLLTGAVWIPRSHPTQLTDGAAPLQVPAVFGHVQPIPGEAEWRGLIPPDARTFTLPGWIEEAWPALDADDGIAQAVNAVYEGMRLEQEHPSLAHLTFVAAIEGFGMRFAEDVPCDCHPGCPHLKTAAQKRFRKALKTVMTNREVDQVARHCLRSPLPHRPQGQPVRIREDIRLLTPPSILQGCRRHRVRLRDPRGATKRQSQGPGQGTREARLSRAVGTHPPSRAPSPCAIRGHPAACSPPRYMGAVSPR